jgi:hypothetical protein
MVHCHYRYDNESHIDYACKTWILSFYLEGSGRSSDNASSDKRISDITIIRWFIGLSFNPIIFSFSFSFSFYRFRVGGLVTL